MSTETPDYEGRIRAALRHSQVGDPSEVIAAVGIEIVRAIRESYIVPLPDEVLEALMPVDPDKLEQVAVTAPDLDTREFLRAMAAIRREVEL